MIHIDKSKCARCGACVRDCVVHVLTKGEDGFPAFRKENEPFCLNCQHCLAVCARGAVTCNDVGFADTLDVEPLPDGRAEAASPFVPSSGYAGSVVRSTCRADTKSERFSSSAFPTSPTRAFRIRVPCRWTFNNR